MSRSNRCPVPLRPATSSATGPSEEVRVKAFGREAVKQRGGAWYRRPSKSRGAALYIHFLAVKIVVFDCNKADPPHFRFRCKCRHREKGAQKIAVSVTEYWGSMCVQWSHSRSFERRSTGPAPSLTRRRFPPRQRQPTGPLTLLVEQAMTLPPTLRHIATGLRCRKLWNGPATPCTYRMQDLNSMRCCPTL